MELKNNKNKSISTGYVNYQGENCQNEKKSQLSSNKTFETKIDNFKYSKGIFGFIFIFLISLAAFLFAYLYGKKWIIDALTIGSAFGFFASITWFVIRQSFGLKMKYSTRKFLNYLSFKTKRQEKGLLNLSLAVNNINSFEDYEKYVLIQKKNSTITFYFTIAFFTLLFILFIILSLTLTKPN